MSFGIMSHSALCRIQTYVVWDCVVQRNVIGHNVVRRNVVRPTVYVSINPIFICSSSHWLLFLQLLLPLIQNHYLYFLLFLLLIVGFCFFSCYCLCLKPITRICLMLLLLAVVSSAVTNSVSNPLLVFVCCCSPWLLFLQLQYCLCFKPISRIW